MTQLETKRIILPLLPPCLYRIKANKIFATEMPLIEPESQQAPFAISYLRMLYSDDPAAISLSILSTFGSRSTTLFFVSHSRGGERRSRAHVTYLGSRWSVQRNLTLRPVHAHTYCVLPDAPASNPRVRDCMRVRADVSLHEHTCK